MIYDAAFRAAFPFSILRRSRLHYPGRLLNFTIPGEASELAALQGRETALLEALRQRIDWLSLRLQRHIQRDKLSGQVLQRRTGKLTRSIEVIPATIEGGTVSGGVSGAGGPAFYGRFHEYGTDRSYTIVPVTRQALRWMQGGVAIFAKRVTHPPIEERSFLRSAADDLEGEFIDDLTATVARVLSATPNL